MTKPGKCDCCRQRKIKVKQNLPTIPFLHQGILTLLIIQCDERCPTCGPCAKTGRQCVYTYGQVSGFVEYQHESHISIANRAPSSSSSTGRKGGKSEGEEVVLSLRSSKSTPFDDSPGLMQTFKLSPANRVSTASMSGGSSRLHQTEPANVSGAIELETKEDATPELPAHLQALLLQWRRFICHISAGKMDDASPWASVLYSLGDWVDIVPINIGQDDVVYTAVDAVLCGAVVCISRNPQLWEGATMANLKAQEMLRASLDKQTSGLLIATKLLDFVEVCMGSPYNSRVRTSFLPRIRGIRIYKMIWLTS